MAEPLAPAEIAAMRDELAAVQVAFPRIVEYAGHPTPATAANVLRYARRVDPEAQPAEVAWYLRRRVMHGRGWRTWGGVVVAAGDYSGGTRQTAPVSRVAEYGPSFAEWLAGRESTEELEAEWLRA
jgi:hypothetical protein